MSNNELRQKATLELTKALGDINKAVEYLDLMVTEVKAYQEIAADVAEMLG